MYLVLRVCRACNHRGTAKRPSTPSHSASRHSIFFSPRPPRSSPLGAGASLFPGPNRPLAPRDYASFSLLAVPPSRRRFVASRRCAHSIIIIGFRSWTTDLSLSVFTPSAVRFPSSPPSFVPPVYLRISRPNSVALRYRLTDEAGSRTQRDARQLFRQLYPPLTRKNTWEFIIETLANPRIPRHVCIYAGFSMAHYRFARVSAIMLTRKLADSVAIIE